MGEVATLKTDQLELGAFASLAFGIVGDAMGTPIRELEPETSGKVRPDRDLQGDGTDERSCATCSPMR